MTRPASEESAARPPHPGTTPAQRKALDAIGCGEFTPSMSPRTRKNLLDAGLIVQCGTRTVGRDRLRVIEVPEYVMPIPVHMQWCSSVAATDEEMAAFETGL